jgi:hypothetical protein
LKINQSLIQSTITKIFKVGSEAGLIVKISERGRIQHLLQQEEFA